MPFREDPIRKRRHTKAISIALGVLLFGACFPDFDEILPQDPPVWTDASFAYGASSLTGVHVLEGTLVITTVDSARFSGTWEIHWLPGADTTILVGPQVGTGALRGLITTRGVAVDLLQNDSTQFVRLIGNPEEEGWRGRWFFRESRPSLRVRLEGTFTATQHP